MKHREVFLALSTDEFHCAKYLGSVFQRSKAAVFVLGVKGGEDNIFSNLVKVLIVTAFRADDSIGRGRKVVWLHKKANSAGGCLHGVISVNQVQFFAGNF